MATKVPSNNGGIMPWIGWGISTLLLLFLNRKSNKEDDTSQQQPSKFTDNNVNNIGNPVPVVLGRAMIKNPLISYYGDFRADIYTEEYGMHSDVDFKSKIYAALITGLLSCFVPQTHPVTTTGGAGVANDSTNGIYNKFIATAVEIILLWILSRLFKDHMGRTTIQKGFKYYLGWQHIICWTGENVGVKRLWMNVYDTEVEQSTQQGVWGGNIAWKKDNLMGLEAYIDQPDMFGGVDEGGGFIGSVRFYFGDRVQPKDDWMIRMMTISQGVPQNLKGLTPKYPMYLTCVVSHRDKQSGAYIGKQATIPEMWFEVVNYPSTLADNTYDYRRKKYEERVNEFLKNIEDYIGRQSPNVQSAMQPYMDAILKEWDNWWKAGTGSQQAILGAIDNARNNCPQSIQAEFISVTTPLYNLITKGVWTLGRLGDDLNPAEAIYEILVNRYWGCHYEGDRIDTDSLVDLGITCEDEGLGVSCLINRVAQANEYITKILNHINGVKYDNPTTGKLSFKLIRNDYDVNKIKKFDVTNCESCEFSRLDWSETNSGVALNFTYADDKYETGQLTVNDISNSMITGTFREQSVDGEYFTTPANARWLANTSLLTLGYPLSAVNLVTNRYGYNVTIGEPILVNWEPFGITKMVFRITDIDYSTLTDGRISITAVEDVFGFDKLQFDFSESPQWTDPEKVPEVISRYLYSEIPYEVSMSLDTYVYAFAAKPSASTVYWDVWRYVNGGYSMTTKSGTWSTVGRMVNGFPEDYSRADSPTGQQGFEFISIGVGGSDLIDEKMNRINSDMIKYNRSTKLNLLVCDNEIMSYDRIWKDPSGHYWLQGVVRGVFDTVPKAHTAESIMYFFDYALDINGGNPIARAGQDVDEQIELKTESLTYAQPFDILDIEHFHTTRRSEQPSIMANLKFGADKATQTLLDYNYPTDRMMSYDVLFNFIGRNKFNNMDILEQTDSQTVIDVADSTRNIIEVHCNGEEFDFSFDARANGQNVTDIRLKWTEFCRKMNNKVAKSNTTSLIIKTYDNDKQIYSYDSYHKQINWVVPVMGGVVTDVSQVQAFADTIVQPSLNSIVLPETSVSPQITLTFEDCVMIFIGTPAVGTNGIIGQDGNRYELSTEAYRIDGYDSNGKAIGHKIDLEEEFIFRSNYNDHDNNKEDYYRRRTNQWIPYSVYTGA